MCIGFSATLFNSFANFCHLLIISNLLPPPNLVQLNFIYNVCGCGLTLSLATPLKAQAHIFSISVSFYKYFDAEKFQALLSTMLVFFPYARSMNCARVILINNLPKDLDIKYVHIRRIKKTNVSQESMSCFVF